jgi:hypothetical protein
MHALVNEYANVLFALTRASVESNVGCSCFLLPNEREKLLSSDKERDDKSGVLEGVPLGTG